MIHLNNHFFSKNPYKKKFEDQEALTSIYEDTMLPKSRPFVLGNFGRIMN